MFSRVLGLAFDVVEEVLASRRHRREKAAADVARLEMELAHLGSVVRALAPKIDADIAKLGGS